MESNFKNEDILEIQNLIRNGSSFANGVSIGKPFKWVINNISNHKSDKTIQILSFEEASKIISSVYEDETKPSELRELFTNCKEDRQIYLHFGAY